MDKLPVYEVRNGSVPGTERTTKDHIADAAERLFSTHSYEGVSVRDIANLAGVQHALVRYHFGSKEGLYASLFERRYHFITSRRVEELKNVHFKPNSAATVRQILRVWFEPVLELTKDPQSASFAYLLVRERSEAESDRHGIYAKHLDPAAKSCIEALARALPDAKREDIVRGYIWSMEALMSTVAGTSRLRRLSSRLVAESDIDDLVEFTSHGVLAIVRLARRNQMHQ